MKWESVVLCLAGLFAAAGGAFGWGFFMNSRRAQIFVRLFGHTGARGFYVFLGVLLFLAGVWTAISGPATRP
ncbi:MAG: hypothetical protein IT449_01235 [Phycisphaerales bacterium]|nr:hypothetical protein [Phycisphaerales bacterium]